MTLDALPDLYGNIHWNVSTISSLFNNMCKLEINESQLFIMKLDRDWQNPGSENFQVFIFGQYKASAYTNS